MPSAPQRKHKARSAGSAPTTSAPASEPSQADAGRNSAIRPSSAVISAAGLVDRHHELWLWACPIAGRLPPLSLNENPSFNAQDDLQFKNSFPMDWGRRFRAGAGQQLVSWVQAEMRRGEQRVRRRSDKLEAKQRASVEVLLANLFAASANVDDPVRYVAVSFDRNAYGGTELSLDAMSQCRDYLDEQGFIELGRGFRGYEYGGGDETWGRRTRMQATDLLRERFEELRLDRKALMIPPSQLIRIKAVEGAAPSCPDEVVASRELLLAINRRLAEATISIEKPSPAHLADYGGGVEGQALDYAEGAERDGGDAEPLLKRSYAGDLTATSLYRSFKGDWSSGGRLYGGWWMSVERHRRPYITIDGVPTVELDYKTLHPRLLYHREGLPLNFDPYTLPALPSERVRELGKRTFNRLLNTASKRGRDRLRVKAAPGDKLVLPPGWSFMRYVDALVERLAPIHKWLGTGAGGSPPARRQRPCLGCPPKNGRCLCCCTTDPRQLHGSGAA